MEFNFSDPTIAKGLVGRIEKLAKNIGNVKLMELCGTHTYTIARAGIKSLLPENITLISGPGCPVCITPDEEIDLAIRLAMEGITVCTFGDMLRVPGGNRSLEDVKKEGGDVRVVYSVFDALHIAKKNPEKEIMFFAVGFETTAPATALAIKEAPPNFSVLSAHRRFPPAMEALLKGGSEIEGFINPGHVSSIVGIKPYQRIAELYHIPQVIAGFEPLDVLVSIVILLKMIIDGSYDVVNEYSRVVKEKGNIKAMGVIDEVFETGEGVWRGLGIVPASGLRIREKWEEKDAHKKFGLKVRNIKSKKGCRCGDVLRGIITPLQCPLFSSSCTPATPLGPCMVSSEGACGIAYQYEREENK